LITPILAFPLKGKVKARFFVAPLLKNDSRRIWIPDKNIQE